MRLCHWPWDVGSRFVLRLIARRLGEEIESRPGPLDALIAAAASRPEEFQAQVVAGLSDALTGWRKAVKPASWDRLRSNARHGD